MDSAGPPNCTLGHVAEYSEGPPSQGSVLLFVFNVDMQTSASGEQWIGFRAERKTTRLHFLHSVLIIVIDAHCMISRVVLMVLEGAWYTVLQATLASYTGLHLCARQPQSSQYRCPYPLPVWPHLWSAARLLVVLPCAASFLSRYSTSLQPAASGMQVLSPGGISLECPVEVGGLSEKVGGGNCVILPCRRPAVALNY